MIAKDYIGKNIRQAWNKALPAVFFILIPSSRRNIENTDGEAEYYLPYIHTPRGTRNGPGERSLIDLIGIRHALLLTTCES